MHLPYRRTLALNVRTLRSMLFRLMESIVRYSQINNLTMEVRFRALCLKYSYDSLLL
jgi:hypothetical protein